MKIKIKHIPFKKVLEIKKPKHKRPRKPNIIFTTLIRLLSIGELWATRFKYTKSRMDEAGEGPYLILMNHSCFLDLKIASKIFYPMPYCIVCTSDALIGKEWLMRLIGGIPTQKYVSDVSLIIDMMHAIKNKKTSVLMYPEAGYSFDGRSTVLPRKLGTLIKKLGVPVLTVITDGAFLHDPLYNCLQQRKTQVSAHLNCLLTKDEINQKSVEEIDKLIDNAFSFDNFKSQYENKIRISEKFRADGLNRILYKCPACKVEGKMLGKGTAITCNACGKSYEMNELGQLEAKSGETEFPHIPDWYNWQREFVRNELEKATYSFKADVDIAVLADYKSLYMVGDGHLKHDKNGFVLTGCDGELHYEQPPTVSHSLNSDFYWYEIGDVISIGNKDRLYYCFPKGGEIVARARLATEELYKIKHNL